MKNRNKKKNWLYAMLGSVLFLLIAYGFNAYKFSWLKREGKLIVGEIYGISRSTIGYKYVEYRFPNGNKEIKGRRGKRGLNLNIPGKYTVLYHPDHDWLHALIFKEQSNRPYGASLDSVMNKENLEINLLFY